ncbi:MAG TPA: hypothetical protein VGJ45_26785 [Pseudonocardiaceae bacterium]|jgi:hypothetical protein
MRLSLPVAAVLAAVFPLTVIGCTSGSSAAPDNGAHSTTAAPLPAANLPTGTQLKGLLAPKSFFAAGYAPVAASTADSHEAFGTQTTPASPKPDCTLLGGTGWFTVTGMNPGKASISFAQAAYLDATTNTEQDQQVFAYSDNGASAQLDAVGKLAKLCPSYPDPATHSKVKVAEHATSGLGDGGYAITLTDPDWKNGSTLEAVRVGTEDVFVYSTSGQDNGATDATRLAGYLVRQLNGLPRS